ncbi:MAG: hypothetical protein H0X30_13395 [Anaerolineae bacterium]|nr:hypothetical protein [Anaerolineae bacterium]
MSLTIIDSNPTQVTFRQRWNHYLVLVAACIGLVAASSLRDNALFAVTPYINTTAGIRALYPRNWLIDTSGDYIFRVQDASRVGFKTTIQVAVQAVSPNTTTRNLVDALTLNRSQLLAGYHPLSADNEFALPDGTLATAVSYNYAAINADPFLDAMPVVVKGFDIISIKRGQAVIITFLADSNTYSDDYNTFNRFLSTLEF